MNNKASKKKEIICLPMDKNQAIVDSLNTTKYQRKTEQGINIHICRYIRKPMKNSKRKIIKIELMRNLYLLVHYQSVAN